MEAKSRFKVKLSNEAQELLDGLPNKVREKIISNIRKSTFVLDPDYSRNWMIRIFGNSERSITKPSRGFLLFGIRTIR